MAQVARPDGNVTQTGFTGGFAEIDEASASDADFAYGANNTAAVLEVSVQNVTDPASSTGHVFRYRIAKTNAGTVDGGGNTVTVTAFLIQGTTVIATDTTRTATGTWTEYALTLLSNEADSITDYTDLRLRFTTSASGGSPANRRGGAVSWAEFEVPDASSAPQTATAGIADVGAAALDPTGTVAPLVATPTVADVATAALAPLANVPIVSAANGNWSDTGTWVGGVVPGNGDTVRLSHNVTVDVNTTVGLSGATGTAAITAITANKVLTIATGVTLTLRGDYVMKGQFAVKTDCLTMQAGSHLLFDASQAAAPSTTYYRVRPDAGGTGASIAINGTSGSLCTVSSHASGGNGYLDRNGFASIGQLLATWCDFTRIGDGTRPFYENFYGGNGLATTQSVTLTDCQFDGCGQLTAANSANSGAALDIQRCSWKNVAHATRAVTLPQFTPAGTKNFKDCVVEKDVFIGDGAYDVSGTIFLESYTVGARSSVAVQVGILLRKTTQPTTNLAGDLVDSYVLKDGTFSNPHGVSTGTWNRPFLLDGLVLEYTGSATNGDWLSGGSPSSAQVHTVQRCLQLPTAAGDASGKFLSMGGGANVSWDLFHNTYPSDRSAANREIAISWGETYAGHASIFRKVQSNFAWFTTASRAVVTMRFTGSVQLTTGADVSHNATWNGYTGTDGLGYDSYSIGTAYSGTAPGASDVTVPSDPFVDRTRCLATWDASLGGPGTTANALAELAKRNDRSGFNTAYTITALIAWVRGGFSLTGTAGATLENAGHDGATIGATQYVGPHVVGIAAVSAAAIDAGVTQDDGAAVPVLADVAAAALAPAGTLGPLVSTPVLADVASAAGDATVGLGALVASPALADVVATALDAPVTLGPLVATPGLADVAAAALDPTGVLGALAVTPGLADVAAAALDPTGTLGALVATPALADGTTAALDAVAVPGPLTVTPTLADVLTAALDAPASAGGVIATPTLADLLAAALAPTVALGPLVATPSPADVATAGGAPTVVLGALLATPGLADALSAALAPSVALGGLLVAPALADAVAAALAPTVSLGGLVVSPALADVAAAALDAEVGAQDLATPVTAAALAAALAPVIVLGATSAQTGVADVVTASPDAIGTLGGAVATAGTAAAVTAALDALGSFGGVVVTPAAADALTGLLTPGTAFGALVVTPALADVGAGLGAPSALLVLLALPGTASAAGDALGATVAQSVLATPAEASALASALNVIGRLTVDVSFLPLARWAPQSTVHLAAAPASTVRPALTGLQRWRLTLDS